MRLSELAGETFAPDPVIAGLTADSRQVGQGFLFAAMPGALADGAKFIPQAEERGAAAILARPGVASSLPLIVDDNPRRRFSQMAARFYPHQPEVIAGITGTNGKTSTALFAAQLWAMLGRESASLGTLGVRSAIYSRDLAHTTPEPALLHETLQELADAGATHLAMEVSSHALAQHRADGVRFSLVAFTNITQDHLDYHEDFDDYLAAKSRLFTELLREGGAAVVNADGEGADAIVAAARGSGLKVMMTGAAGADIKLISSTPHASGLNIEVEAGGARYALSLPLIGVFQAENALLAAGIVIASGAGASTVLPLLAQLAGAPGRMQRVGDIAGAGVFVDYAHTPDAVATALQAIRPHAKGRVIAIIGAGGDRDKTKRPLMGRAAAANADIVIVTDDNPRTEEPSAIRRQVMEGCPEAEDIGDRGEAIARGVAMLQAGDVLLIMGKGHETGQKIGDQVLPFDDVAVASRAIGDRRKELGI